MMYMQCLCFSFFFNFIFILYKVHVVILHSTSPGPLLYTTSCVLEVGLYCAAGVVSDIAAGHGSLVAFLRSTTWLRTGRAHSMRMVDTLCATTSIPAARAARATCAAECAYRGEYVLRSR